jgi:hypothetical protein
MKRKRYIIILFFLIGIFDTDAQCEKKTAYLISLKVKEMSIFPILDSIVEHEKKCSYYSSDLIFSISMRKFTDYFACPEFYDCYIMVIHAVPDRNLAFSLKRGGYFYYKNYLFVVDGKHFNVFFDTLPEHKSFIYYEFNMNKVTHDKKGRMLLYVLDDSPSNWEYIFYENKWLLHGYGSICD